MNIRVKSSAPSGRDIGLDHGGSPGKGDSPRNCLSAEFRNNFDAIKWGDSPGSRQRVTRWKRVYK